MYVYIFYTGHLKIQFSCFEYTILVMKIVQKIKNIDLTYLHHCCEKGFQYQRQPLVSKCISKSKYYFANKNKMYLKGQIRYFLKFSPWFHYVKNPKGLWSWLLIKSSVGLFSLLFLTINKTQEEMESTYSMNHLIWTHLW